MEILIALLGPLHPPMVHFAVACPILAFFAVLAQKVFQKEWLGFSAAALWAASFLSALGAWASGHLFSLHQGMETEWALFPPATASQGRLLDHALLGSAALLFSFATLWAAAKILRGKPLPFGVQLVLGLVSAVLFGLTGHEGGEIVYGPESQPSPAGQVSNLSDSSAAPVKSDASVPGESSDWMLLIKDYRKNLVKMNNRSWNSRTHGHRWVNTYVSKEAAAAYQKSDILPEGSRVVKESFEDVDGKPSDQPGPLYVMVKGPLASSPRSGGWRFALSWDNPAPNNPENIKMPVKWLPGNPRLNACVKCHNHFKLADDLGGIPEGYEAK